MTTRDKLIEIIDGHIIDNLDMTCEADESHTIEMSYEPEGLADAIIAVGPIVSNEVLAGLREYRQELIRRIKENTYFVSMVWKQDLEGFDTALYMLGLLGAVKT